MPVIKKHILFISSDGMTDPLGQSQVIPYLKGLTKLGYRFTILSCDKPDRFIKNKAYVENLLLGFEIEWISLPYNKKIPILSPFLDFKRMQRKALELHKKFSFDMVHTRPSLPQLIAMKMKKNTGIKFMNDIRGFWADERIDGEMWNLKNPIYKILYKFFKEKETESLKMADYNTCLTYKGKEELLSRKNVKQPLKISVVPCSVDLELFDYKNINETKKNIFREELNIKEDDFIISYLGSIGGWYLTKEMMRFCKMLLTKKPNTKFLFISNNNYTDIENAAMEFGIPKENLIIKFGMRHEVPILLSFSNYSLFFIKNCYSKIASSPTKHGEIMAMGIPTITNVGVGDVKEIMEKYEAGILINNFTESDFEKAINIICDNDNNFNKEKIRAGAIDYYNLENTVKTYAQVYEEVLIKN